MKKLLLAVAMTATVAAGSLAPVKDAEAFFFPFFPFFGGYPAYGVPYGYGYPYGGYPYYGAPYGYGSPYGGYAPMAAPYMYGPQYYRAPMAVPRAPAKADGDDSDGE